MRQIKTMVGLISLCSGVAGLWGTAMASPIAVTAIRSTNSGNEAMAYDSSTGAFYVRDGSYGSSVQVYRNAVDFEAGKVNRVVTIPAGADGVGILGTYIAAANGAFYGRTSYLGSTTVSSFSDSDGSLITSKTLNDLGGANPVDTFNTSSYSGPNMVADGTSLYIFGSASPTWYLETVDAALNVSKKQTVTTGTLGFAFDINGLLFTGTNGSSSGASASVSSVFNIITGTSSPALYSITGLVNATISDAIYDKANDTLYIQDSSGKLDNIKYASAAFNAPSNDPTAVAEPMSLVALGTGLFAMGMIRRRRT